LDRVIVQPAASIERSTALTCSRRQGVSGSKACPRTPVPLRGVAQCLFPGGNFSALFVSIYGMEPRAAMLDLLPGKWCLRAEGNVVQAAIRRSSPASGVPAEYAASYAYRGGYRILAFVHAPAPARNRGHSAWRRLAPASDLWRVTHTVTGRD
jgi:hypothetical protein